MSGTNLPDSAGDASDQDDSEMEFSLAGIRQGYVECIPIAIGVAGYGIVFGVLARQVGLSTAEAALMSATVLAGAAQLIAMQLWADPLPVATVVITTSIVNLRYILMGAALRPWFSQLSPLQAYGSVFFTADENWALTMGQLTAGSKRGAFLLGSGLAIWSFWITATVIGATIGGGLGDPAQCGLDFVLTAVFIAIAVELWGGRSDLLPWGVALCVAVIVAQYIPGRWYILLGGFAGSAIEVARHGE